jgi:Xaa-Pro aminopeptidase
MLTPSEIESLRRAAKETDACAQKAFSHLREETRRLRAKA